MESTPPYEQAIDSFQKFLKDEGWAHTIVWCRPDDVVRRVDRNMVVRRRPLRQAADWARRYYESGHARGLGISLSAECEIDGAVYATMFWTSDEQEAESRMMPNHGLKMSAALPRTRGESVGWLAWWFWRKALETRHKAIAAGARMKKKEARGTDSATNGHD